MTPTREAVEAVADRLSEQGFKHAAADVRALWDAPEGEPTPTTQDSDDAEWDRAFRSPEFRALADAARDKVLFASIVRRALADSPRSATKVAAAIAEAVRSAARSTPTTEQK